MSALYRRYTLRLALIAAVLLVPFVLLALWMKPLAGDLTRLGGWSERDFVWTAPQPVLPVVANQLPHPESAQVLVLGDSFSMGNVWQSVLQRRTGLRTLSFGHDESPCLEAFVQRAISPPHAAARVVVLQTIERHFLDRFESPRPCTTAPLTPFAAPAGSTQPTPLHGAFSLDWRYLLKTAVNTLRLARQPDAVIEGPEVINAPLNGAAGFSNRRADRLLYYAYDDAKRHWTQPRIDRAIGTLRALDERLRAHGKQLLLVVVPDKSTAYRGYLSEQVKPFPVRDVGAQLAGQGLAVIALEAPIREAIRTQVDVYLPNDTHLSSRGFEFLGHAVADWPGFSALAGAAPMPRPQPPMPPAQPQPQPPRVPPSN